MVGSYFFWFGVNVWVFFVLIVCCVFFVLVELVDDLLMKVVIVVVLVLLIGVFVLVLVVLFLKFFMLYEKVVVVLWVVGYYGVILGFFDSFGEVSSIIKEGVILFVFDDGVFSGFNLNLFKFLMIILDYYVVILVYNYN